MRSHASKTPFRNHGSTVAARDLILAGCGFFGKGPSFKHVCASGLKALCRSAWLALQIGTLTGNSEEPKSLVTFRQPRSCTRITARPSD